VVAVGVPVELLSYASVMEKGYEYWNRLELLASTIWNPYVAYPYTDEGMVHA